MAGLRWLGGEQFSAIVFLRWRLFVNSLATVRGRLNFVSQSLVVLLVTGAGIGGGTALAVTAWGLVSEGKLNYLPILFWPVCVFWQLFPIMATAFTHNVDTSALLRFPP